MTSTARNHHGIKLSALLAGIARLGAEDDVAVTGLVLDSRRVTPGDCFVAVGGSDDHGIRYVREAVERGAAAVLTENLDLPNRLAVPTVQLGDLRARLGALADRFYGAPSREVDTVAVTGTNGKTTITALLAAALSSARGACGYVGTLGIGAWGALAESANTTPDVLSMHRFLDELRADGSDCCAIEASSHALAQGRLDGLELDVGVFTNLSHDHLDYHGSLRAYGAAKKRLFEYELKHAVVNLDDPLGREILAELGPQVEACGFSLAVPPRNIGKAVWASRLEAGLDGLSMTIDTPAGEAELHSPLIGEFNAANLLAAAATLLALNVPLADTVRLLGAVHAVPGRMELLDRPGADTRRAPTVVVDYAHSPDSLERALATLRSLSSGSLICVFGCGGDRDRAKRPLMGRIANEYADRVIITSDNPRSEDPHDIARQIVAGAGDPGGTEIILDRRAAIESALGAAIPGDVVLIAGKGHETHQQIGNAKTAFSDRDVALAAFAQAADRDPGAGDD